jgi:hypothetical protein
MKTKTKQLSLMKRFEQNKSKQLRRLNELDKEEAHSALVVNRGICPADRFGRSAMRLLDVETDAAKLECKQAHCKKTRVGPHGRRSRLRGGRSPLGKIASNVSPPTGRGKTMSRIDRKYRRSHPPRRVPREEPFVPFHLRNVGPPIDWRKVPSTIRDNALGGVCGHLTTEDTRS